MYIYIYMYLYNALLQGWHGMDAYLCKTFNKTLYAQNGQKRIAIHSANARVPEYNNILWPMFLFKASALQLSDYMHGVQCLFDDSDVSAYLFIYILIVILTFRLIKSAGAIHLMP